MLQTQVNYWQLQETKLHNRNTEEQAANELIETNRHNLATEKQQARQATAALKQAAAAAKNANTNLFIAKYNKDLGYKNLAVNQKNAASNAKQAQAALQNAQSNALQASAAWKNALTNAYAAEANAKYQQNMAAVAKFNAQLSADRNSWEKEAQSIRNLSEWAKQDQMQSQTALNYANKKTAEKQASLIEAQTNSQTILDELRAAQRDLAKTQSWAVPTEQATSSVDSISRFIDALLPF